MQLAEILLKTMQELGKPDANGDIQLWRELENDDYKIFVIDKRVLAQLDKVKDVQLQFLYKNEEKTKWPING
ncbi:MAG: hypothetical protein HC840_27670 [Leptolyngbyaceae cyanobacterium RM2_2_4]|nr:hypothetical protein [Leptolyngbyaceae cyanobacterium RM2_2_4]